jgi:hypothetical protein
VNHRTKQVEHLTSVLEDIDLKLMALGIVEVYAKAPSVVYDAIFDYET